MTNRQPAALNEKQVLRAQRKAQLARMLARTLEAQRTQDVADKAKAAARSRLVVV